MAKDKLKSLFITIVGVCITFSLFIVAFNNIENTIIGSGLIPYLTLLVIFIVFISYVSCTYMEWKKNESTKTKNFKE